MAKEYYWETYEEILLDLSKRFKKIRKRKKLTQKRLSEISGVSYGSIKRFEQIGDISLSNLTKLTMAMNVQSEIKKLFVEVPYKNVEEIMNENKYINTLKGKVSK